MDFNWPVNKVWWGYLERAPCTDCDAEGKANGAWCQKCEGKKTYRVITHPPEGDGFQLWETTSEGSPISPVFATLDELCAWCADHATTFADFRASADQWKAMLGEGLVYHTEGNITFI